ncbi:MAG: heterodisulfide reductase, partial [Delftia sp.]|nr:heterodisulfide reductase [Delftia sp.]
MQITPGAGTELTRRVNRLSGQTVQLCYHCHKCTAGCPSAYKMAYGPDRILRMIQFGQKEQLLTSQDLWLCAACETCGTRCHNEIDVAAVVDALRQIAQAEGAAIADTDSARFHSIFLGVVRQLGRSYEAGLLVLHKLVTLNLLDDMGAGLRLIFKRKVPFLPKRLKGVREVKDIFAA